MRKLKSKMAFFLALNIALSPTVSFSQENRKQVTLDLPEVQQAQIKLSTQIDFSQYKIKPLSLLGKNSDELKKTHNAVKVSSNLLREVLQQEISGEDSHESKRQKLGEHLNKMKDFGNLIAESSCSSIQSLVNAEAELRKRKGDTSPYDSSSLSNLLPNFKESLDVNKDKETLASFHTLVFFFEKGTVLGLVDQLVNQKKISPEQFQKDCKDIVNASLAKGSIARLADSVKPQSKSFGSSPEEIYSENHVGLCGGRTGNSGLHSYYKTSCDEGSNFIKSEDFVSLVNALTISERPFEVYGSNHFCQSCLEKKYAALSPSPRTKFPDKKRDLKQDYIKKIAAEKTKASFVKFSKHMEDILKTSFHRPIKNRGSRFQDFYCLNELNQAVSHCKGKGQSVLEDVAKSLKLCDGNDCKGIKAQEMLAKFEQRVREREPGNQASCNTMDFRNASVMSLHDIHVKEGEVLFRGLKGLDADIIKSLVLYEMRGENSASVSPSKALSRAIAGLMLSTDDGYTGYDHVFDAIQNNSEEFEQLRRDFGVRRETRKSLTKRALGPSKGTIINSFNLKLKEDNEFNALKTRFSQSRDPNNQKSDFETMSANIEKMLAANMEVFPEMKTILSDKKSFFKQFDLGKNEKDKNLFQRLSGQNAKSEESSYKELADIFEQQTSQVCKQFNSELKHSLCIDENLKDVALSPSDLADIAKAVVADKEPKQEAVVALSSLTCELNNSGVMSPNKTIGDPAEYLTEPSSFALSLSSPSNQLHDELNVNPHICEMFTKSFVDSAEMAARIQAGFAPATAENLRILNNDNRNWNKKSEEIAATNGHAGHVLNAYDNVTHEQEKIASSSSNGDVLYGGYNSNNSRPGGGDGVNAGKGAMKKLSSAWESSQTTGTSGISYTTGSESSRYDGYSDTDNNANANNSFSEAIANTNLMGVSNTLTPPPYYSQTYPTGNVTTYDSNDPNRKSAIQNLNKEFSGEFTPEDLNRMSTEDLKELLKLAEESKGKSDAELEGQRKVLEEEKKNLELQKQIFALQQEREKLLAESRKVAPTPPVEVKAQELSKNTPVIGTANSNSVRTIDYNSGAQNINRVPAAIVNADGFASNSPDKGKTGGGFASGSVASGSGSGNAALKSYHSNFTAVSNEGRAQVPYSEVDRYLNYIRDNKVAGNQLIKRNSQGELLELLIPNMQGDLIPVDVSALTESELEALEKKVAELFDNQEKSGVIVANGVNVKTGQNLTALESIEEKIAKLQNEEKQEAHLIDLKMKILSSLSKR